VSQNIVDGASCDVSFSSPRLELHDIYPYISTDFLFGHINWTYRTTISSDPYMSVGYAVVHLSIMII